MVRILALSAFTVHTFAWTPPDDRDCGKGIDCFSCDPVFEPSFDCSAATRLESTCSSNKNNRISSTKATSADNCCSKCSAESQCLSWTFWGDHNCNIFSTGDGLKDGNCTSGSAVAPPAPAPKGPACKDCPNIILMFTDDQDLVIGGMDPMVKTKDVFSGGGMTATHWNIHTPICAPSRAELMSGRYYQNIINTVRTPPKDLCGSGAVGHVDLKEKVYPNLFVRQLREKMGYNTALFGKCMNGNCHDPVEMHGAFDRWFEGTSFQDGTFWDSESPGHSWKNNTYGGGYGTSQIGNKTIEWIRSLQQQDDQRPFFIYFAPHAPHSPATPAKWYASAPECDIIAPRTPSWNYSTPEFHNLVSRQPPFNDNDVRGIDALAKKRCRSLMSVDDSYAEIHAAVEELGLLDNTYFLISSDHGYNLGHHRMPSNKFMLYDHSLKIPMIFKGPGIQANTSFDFLGTQVDLAPTILGLAGLEASEGVDGRSVVPLLVAKKDQAPASVQRHLKAAKVPERTSSFVQYYNQGPWEVDTRHPLDDWSNTYIGVTFRNSTNYLKYAEYDPYGKQSGFSSVYFYELFDLDADPYELHNIYNQSSLETKDMLHTITRQWYECQGKTCEGIGATLQMTGKDKCQGCHYASEALV